MEFSAKERRKNIRVWVSDEERELVEEKAKYYGYTRLSNYIRDACIYEKVTYIDLQHRKELYDAYAENTKKLNKIAKYFRHISRYATQLTKEDLKDISINMFTILKNQKNMLKLIEKKLDLEVWKEINRKGDIERCL